MMQKRTTTQKLHNAITSNLLKVAKAEIHHKSSKQVDVLSEDGFKDSIDFLAETIFADLIDWHFERSSNADGGYIIESGSMNPYSENIVIAHLRVCEGVDVEDIVKALVINELEE